MGKTIFFDLDDTLYDRSVPYCRAFAEFFDGKYAEKADAAFLTVMRRGYEVFVAAHTGQMTMEAMHIYRHQSGLRDVGIEISETEALTMQALYETAQRQIILTERMERILTCCKKCFEAVGVITNGGVASQYAKLRALGMERWVRPELMLVSDEVGVMKPGAEIFRLAEQRAGARAGECVYVGDSISQDVTSALSCGWRSIWFNRRGEQTGAQTDLTAHSEEELENLLRGFSFAV